MDWNWDDLLMPVSSFTVIMFAIGRYHSHVNSINRCSAE